MRGSRKRSAQGKSYYAPAGRLFNKVDLSTAAEATAPVQRARHWIAERLEGRLLLSGSPAVQATPLILQTATSVAMSSAPNGIWTGSGDGHSWSDPNNWDNGVLPGPNDDVVINDPHGNTVVHDTSDDTIHSVTATTPLTLGGGVTLTLLADSTATTFTEANGNLAGGGNLSISGLFTWAGGTESGLGTTTLAQGGSLNLTGGSVDGRHLVFGGTATFSGGLQSSDGAIIDVTSTGSIDIGDQQIISYNGGVRPTLNVAGVLKKTAGPNTSLIDVNLNDTGSIQIGSGILMIRGDQATVAGPVSVSAGTTLQINTATAMTFATGSNVQSNGSVVFSPDGTVTLEGAFSNTGTTELDNGTLAIGMPGGLVLPSFVQNRGVLSGGDVTVSGTYAWAGGEQDGPGATFVPQGGSLVLTNGTILDGRHISVSGTMTVAGSLANANAAVIDINPTGVLDIAGNQIMSQFFGARTTLNVAGTLKKSAGASDALVDVELNDTGAIQIDSGNLRVRSDVATVSGPVSIAAGAALAIATSTSFTFNPSSSVSGAGTVQVATSATANFNSSVYSPALTELDSGTMVIGSAGGLTVPGFTQNNGTLSGGNLTVNGPLLWAGGTEVGPGTTFVPQGQTLTMTNSQIADGRHLSIAGTVTEFSFFVAEDGAVIDVTPTGLYNFANDNGIAVIGSTTTTLNNAGLVEKSAGAGASALNVTFNNSGNLKIQSGILHFQGNFDQTAGTTSLDGGNLQGDTLLHFDGGKLTGAGTVFGSIDNAATVSLASTLTVTGTYTQEPTGNLSIELDGPASGQFGQVISNGGASIAGALGVTLGAGFVPGGGTNFLILSATTITGAFTSTTLPSIPVGHLAVTQGSGSIVINSTAANGIWTGNGDGHSWADPNNWSNGVLPGPNDDVVISDSHGATVVHDVGNDTVHSITASTPLTLQLGTLSLTADSTVTTFTQSGGTLNGGGSLTISSLFSWPSGTETGPGTTTVPQGSSLNVSGGTLDGRHLVIGGTATLTGGLHVGDGAVIDVTSTGSLAVGDNQSMFYVGGARPMLNVAGLLTKSAGPNASFVDANLNDTGSIQVGSGTLVFRSDQGTVAGPVSVAAGASLQIDALTAFTFAAGSNIQSTGTVVFGPDGTVTLDGTFSNTGTTELNGGTLFVNMPGGLVLPSFLQSNGVLTGGDVTVNGNYSWTGGNQTGTGTTFVPQGDSLVLASGTILDGRHISVSGTMTLSGSVNDFNGAVIDINPTGVLDIAGNVAMNYFGGPRTTLNVAGMLKKSAGTSDALLNVELNDTGPIQVNSGTLHVGSDVATVSGSLSVAAGATFLIDTGTLFTFTPTSSVSGAGTVRVNSFSTANFNGGVYSPALTQLDFGTMVIGAAGGLVVPAFTQNGGTLSGGNLTINGPLAWNGGTEAGPGTTFVPQGQTMTITNGNVADGRHLSIAGTVTEAGSLTAFDGTVIDITPTGVYNFTNQNGIATFGQITTILNNSGTVEKSAGASESALSINFNNSGSVKIQAGALHMQGSFDQTAGATSLEGGNLQGDSLLHFDGGTLEGTGTVTGSVDNFGHVALAGPLTVTGTYTQHSIGNLDVELDGTQPGQFGHLTVNGTATLDGDLNVTLGSGFAPVSGNTFQILSAPAGIVGEFFAENMPVFNGGHLSPLHQADGVLLTTTGNQAPVPGPDSAATVANTPVPVDVLLNDFDPDGDPLSILSFTQGSSGTVTAGGVPGRLVYTPLVNANYTDTFTYTLSDDRGGTATGVVTVQVSATTGGNDATTASTALSTGLANLPANLGNWGNLFSISSSNAPLPVVGSNLSSLFSLGGTGGILAHLGLPSLTPVSSFAALAQELTAAGFVVDFTQGAGPSSTDLVQAHFDKTFAPSDFPSLSPSGSYDPSTNSILGGLPAGEALSGLMHYLGSLRFHLSIGVDSSGFYVTSDSGAELDFTGGGNISGSTPAGTQPVTSAGSAQVNYQAMLFGPTGSRVHITDAGFGSGSFLNFNTGGSASVSASLQYSPVDVNLSASWNLTLANNVVTNNVAQATGLLSIPNLTKSQNGIDVPEDIALSVVFNNGLWTIDGSIDAGSQSKLEGFSLNSLHAHATLNNTNVSGKIDGQLSVTPEAASPVVFNFSSSFDNHHFTFTGNVTVNESYIGLNVTQDLLWVHQATYGLSINSVFGASTDVSVSVDADIAVVLPQHAPPGTVPPGPVRVNGFNGTLDSNGKLHLSANSFTVTATNALIITGGLVTLDIDPSNTDPNFVIASLHTLVIQPAAFSAAANNTLDLLQIRRNGFDLVDHLALPDGQLSNIASITGVVADLDLHDTNGTLTGSIGLAAATGSLFASGLASVHATGLSGSIDISTGDVTLGVQTANALLDNLLDVDVSGATLHFGSDITTVFHVDSATATIPGIAGLSFEVDNLNVNTDGSFGFSTVTVKDNGGLLQTIALGGLLPFDITEVQAQLTNPSDLSTLALTVTGTFDFSGLSLPFTPVVQVGNGGTDTFQFSLDINQLKNGIIAPQSFGPVTLGFSGLQLGPAILGGTINLGTFQNGAFSPIGGTVSLGGSLSGISGNATVGLSGTFANTPSQSTLDVHGSFNLSFDLGDGAIVVNNADLEFGLKLINSPTTGQPINFTVVPTLDGLNIGNVSLDLGDLVTLSAANVNINFAAASGQPLVRFGSLSVQFKQGIDFLNGWGGTATDFGIGPDGSIFLFDDASISVNVASNANFGIPFPFHADSVGIVFHPGFLDTGPNHQITGATRIADPTKIGILFSGGLFSNGEFPFNASVQSVELDLNALRNNQFPITNISGGGFGLEPVSLPPFAPVITVAGFLNFGRTPAGNYYLDIGGDFGIQGLGEIGGRLIVSQFGPVAGEVTVPTAVPLGPSGLVLTSVTGGLVFGQAPKTISDASQLTRSDIPGLPPGITATTIAQLVDTAAGHDFWQVPFTVALSGQIIALEAPGMMNLNVGLALNTGGQFAAFGEMDTLGIPFADALMLLDLSSTDPKIFARVTSPNPGNPLGFILPDRTDFQFTFDGAGLTEGLVFGFRTFLQRALTGTQAVANGFMGQLLDTVAAGLQADRFSPLAQQLLAGNPSAVIDRQFLLNRLLALLPQGGLSDVESSLQSAASLAQTVIKQLMDAAGNVSLNLNSLPSSEASAIQGVVSLVNLVGDGASAVAALIANFKDAALAGASAFESVFNPLIDIGGSLQPIVLGIPFGPPIAGAHMSITKGGLVFGANLSPSGLLDATIKSMPVINSIWNTLKFLMPIPFGLFGTENISANVELPFPGSFGSIAGGTYTPIDPFSPNWLVSVGGSLSPFGIQLASFTGAAFSGGNAASSTLFQVAANFSDAFNPVDPTRIIVSSQQKLTLIETLGGIILNSQVLLPSLLLDPGNVFAALPPLPTNPLLLPGYIADLATKLSSYSQAGRVQFYLPSPQSLLQYNLTNFTSDTDRISPSSTFLSETPDQQAAALQNLIDSAYLEGVLNAKILGIQLAAGTIEASPTQFSLSGTIPWLASLQTSFNISFAPRPVPLATFVSIYGRQPNANELNPDGTANIQLPVVSALASVNSTTALTSIFTSWGLPANNFVPLLPAIGAQFRAYSPAFDPTSTDPLLRNGGIEFDSNVGLPGILNSASFKFAITPPTGSAILPDFVAAASVNSLTLAGLVINNATVKIIKVGSKLTVSVDGTGTFLGASVHIHGILNPDFTGNLSIDATTPNGFIVDGFSLSTTLTMRLTRQGNKFTGVASFNSVVTLPSWLSSASGQATANASGTVSSTGDFNLNLAITNFAVGSNTGISLVNATGTGPATFTLIRTSGITTVSISGGIKYSLTTGLPLMGISGVLSSAGSGNLAITFNGTGLNLGGFLLTGGATLAYSPSSFNINVSASLSIPNVLSNAGVSGAITQTGIAQLSLSGGSLTLSPLTVHSFTLSLIRIGTTGLNYKLHAQITVDIPDIITNATVIGDLDSSAFGSLTLSATQVTIFGFTLTNGSFSVTRSSTGSTFSAGATLSFLGQTLTVATPQPLTLSGSGATGSMSLTVNGGAPFGFDGWSVGGTLTLAVTTTSASLSITNGSLTIPNLFTDLPVSGSLNSLGIGTLTVGSPNTIIHPGGANSPFTITGTYTLSRTGSPPVTTFSATNASFSWTGVTTLTVPTFSASSDGHFNVTINPLNLSLAAGGMSFNMGTVSLIADVGGLNFRLHFGGATLSIPNIATGNSALSVPAFDVNTTGSFSVTLVAGQLDFGAVLITGRLIFQRQNGVFALSVANLSNGTAPKLVIGGFANLTLNTFIIAADGTFNVTATVTQFGPSALSIRNASVSVAKTGAALSTFLIHVDSGQLFLPVGNPIDLPNFTINNNASFSRSITVPQLNLGSAFSTTASATFTLSLSNDVLDFSLNNPVGIHVLAGSVGMTLNSFDAASDGTFTGSVSGSLNVLGYQLASATFNVTLNNGVVRMTLPSNKAASVNLGFITVKVSGFVSSNGSFSFTGSTSVSVSTFGIGSASGTASFTLSNSGFAGSFSGSVSALGVTLAGASGTIDSSGLLTVIVLGVPVTWQL
jgi:hypothetical protein